MKSNQPCIRRYGDSCSYWLLPVEIVLFRRQGQPRMCNRVPQQICFIVAARKCCHGRNSGKLSSGDGGRGQDDRTEEDFGSRLRGAGPPWQGSLQDPRCAGSRRPGSMPAEAGDGQISACASVGADSSLPTAMRVEALLRQSRLTGSCARLAMTCSPKSAAVRRGHGPAKWRDRDRLCQVSLR
jgi:hypothetical protein